jgi:hypothetical protein
MEQDFPCIICGTQTGYVSLSFDPPEPLCSVECERQSDEEYHHLLEILLEVGCILYDPGEDDDEFYLN